METLCLTFWRVDEKAIPSFRGSLYLNIGSCKKLEKCKNRMKSGWKNAIFKQFSVGKMQYLDLVHVIPIVKDGGRSIVPFASAVLQRQRK